MGAQGGFFRKCEVYRFGFNGKENDKDWGTQLIQDYGFRLYNPAIAKFLSVDPLSPDYPELTPYQFASNSPIAGIDLDGLEFDGRVDYQFQAPAEPKLGINAVDNMTYGITSPIAVKKFDEYQTANPFWSYSTHTNRTQAYEETPLMLQQRQNVADAKQNFLNSRNLFGCMYALSPVSDIGGVCNAVSEGNYSVAAGIMFFAILPGEADDILFKFSTTKASGSFRNKGNLIEGELKTLNGEGVIFDAKHRLDESKKVLDLDDIGVYNVEDFGKLDAQNRVSPTTYREVMNTLLDRAKEDGITKVNFNFKRVRPEGSKLGNSELRTMSYELKDGNWQIQK